jgi:hypothetical protein
MTDPYRDPVEQPANTPEDVQAERNERRKKAKAAAIDHHVEQMNRAAEATPVYTHAVTWNGRIIKHFTNAGDAQVDRDARLQRRTDDVRLMLPPNRCKCEQIEGEHTMREHWPEHIGTFEIIEYTPPPKLGT